MNEASPLHLLADALPQIIWTAQADGARIWFNQRWFDYSGLSMEDSLGHGWRSVIHPDDSLRASRAWAQACASGEPCETEYRLRRTDGIYRWMLGRALPQRDAAGQVTQWLGTLTDIDELKQAAEHLEKDFALTRIASRIAHFGGWTIELPERVLTWSDENCLIHDMPPGYQPTLEEGIDYFFPEDRPLVRRLVDACAQHGTPYEFVLPKLTAKGRRIWVRSVGEAVRDPDGKIVRLRGAFQDITEQKEAEARTLALETQLRTTLESITDGFCLMDKDWRFVFLNSQAERMLRRAEGELLGKNLWQEFSAIVGTYIEHEYRAAVAEQRSTRLEAFYRPLKTWFVFNVYPTEAGTAVYFQDITQRRAEQAQLRLLETAVSRLNDIVIVAKVRPGKPDPEIVFVNNAFVRLTGYSRQEAIGKSPNFLWGPKSEGAEVEQIRTAVRSWAPLRTEVVNYTKDGKERWVEIDITPIANASGKFTHWVAVERDVTERKQQQQEILRLNAGLEERVLLRTIQLATANKELESFAYSVSHDLRSPLNTIHGFSKLLAKIDAKNISNKGKHYLARIGAGVEQMGELIEGLLTLAHMSREQLKSEPVDLSAMARLIEQDHREREPQRQVQVQVFIQDGMGAHGDPRLLQAVLQNLFANAWKFTSKKPLARIEMGSGLDADGAPLFFVRDNGAGFDMAFTHKLFGTFERLHSPGDFAGTGIGLATVKRIIERHGGRVWAESRVDEGASFYFTLSRQAAGVI
ncbi:PAS domain S-box protein [Polaromonas sp.]|uniref:PAS domain-containing sensor histidine kinase n=1 Tax=Polaromonas sp. TaxID=1869339 RepID=UPI003263B43E